RVWFAGRECATQEVMPCIETSQSKTTGTVCQRVMIGAAQHSARNILRQELDLNIDHRLTESIDQASGNGGSADRRRPRLVDGSRQRAAPRRKRYSQRHDTAR